MDLSSIPPAILTQILGMVEDYIESSRRKHAAQAVPLNTQQRTAMAPFFPATILDQVRLLHLMDARIQDPPFYGMARMMGFKNLPSFADSEAVTYVDVIVSHQPYSDSMLFHELVHAVQYAQLGTREFSSRYVKGFVTGGSYDEIPLEKNAYALEERYSSDRGQVFSVEDEVKQAIAAGTL